MLYLYDSYLYQVSGACSLSADPQKQFDNLKVELTQPYTLVGPPVKGPVLAPLAVYSSTTVYISMPQAGFNPPFAEDNDLLNDKPPLLFSPVFCLFPCWKKYFDQLSGTARCKNTTDAENTQQPLNLPLPFYLEQNIDDILALHGRPHGDDSNNCIFTVFKNV